MVPDFRPVSSAPSVPPSARADGPSPVHSLQRAIADNWMSAAATIDSRKILPLSHFATIFVLGALSWTPVMLMAASVR